MRGYLYVEEDLLGKPNKTYIKRYFVSYKFCGLKWFSKESTDIKNNIYLQCISNDTCGWVYGGSVMVDSVDAEREIPYKDSAIFPFVITLKCGEYETSIRLASKSEEIRKKWIEEINMAMKVMTFVSGCFQNDTLPYPAVFEALKDNVDDEMSLTVGPVNARHLCSMLNYYSVCNPHGLMLHSFVLENAQVNDPLVRYICAVLNLAPYVGVLSLAHNVLSSAGATTLCETLVSCQYLTEVNLSNNFLCDVCAERLSLSLGELKELKVLNLAHNNFTRASVRAFTLRLATHRSKLIDVNFAYNALGDGIAFLVALLCSNQPSHLQRFDISHCGVGDKGVAELSIAILRCKTLQSAVLRSTFLGTNALQLLVKAQADHHVVYQRDRKGQGVSIELGGVQQNSTAANSLSLKALKASLMYVADIAHMRNVVFRRRLLYAEALAHETTADEMINPLHMLQHILQQEAQVSYPLAQLTLCLPAHLRSAYEVLEELSLALHCDSGQLLLLSCSRTDTSTGSAGKTTTKTSGRTTGSPSKAAKAAAEDSSHATAVYVVIFTALDCPANRATVRRNNSYLHSFLQVMGTTTQRIVEASLKNTTAEAATKPAGEAEQGAPSSAAQKLLNIKTREIFGFEPIEDAAEVTEQALYRAAFLRSAQEIFVSLHDMTVKTPTFLRALGVRSVALKYPNPAFLETVHQPEYVVFQSVIRSAGTKGAGLGDHYLPVLYPRMLTQAESNANVNQASEDTDDDETFDTAVRTKPSPAQAVTKPAAPVKTPSGLQSVPEGAAEDVDLEHQYVLSSEEHMITSLQLRQRRLVNEKLITAVRQLYAEKELTSLQAKFWEGAFGHAKYKTVAQDGLKLALNRETGTFVAIHLRQELYEAMLHRDMPQMNKLIAELQSRGAAQGGLALVYALRLRSEILGLQRSFLDITELARSYSELGLVEDFLLSCGKLGYSGPEMFQAVELRQRLVEGAVKRRRGSVMADLPVVKHKALFTNLLISREMESIEDRLDELRGSPQKAELLQAPECVAAEHLLLEYEHTLVLVKSAIKTRNMDALDQALAQAAYNFFYFEEVTRAVNVLNEVSINPAELLRPVVEALRANDVRGLEETFQRIEKVGWMHPAMDASVCTKINDRQNKITQDEVVKSKLIKFCLAIKNGFKVNANEMMQLLRRSYKMKLDDDPMMGAYLKTVSKSMKQFAGVLKQEKAVQALIDSNDIPVLAKLLAGRGSGKLVMCCPSAYVQDEWMHYLQSCCDGKLKDAVENEDVEAKEKLFFTGTLEKAARNDQGLVRGWRQRFFQLNATSLSYFTKARGDRKGIIRVIGGGVRRMDATETGGRAYCIELEEGRDISLIDPDLLAEARKHVLQAKTKEFEAAVRKGIAMKSLEMLTRMMKFAADSDIVLDYNLLNEAKACVNSLKEKNLKRDLRFAAKLVPRSQLDELIALAEKLSLDPNIPSYRTVLALAAKSEVEQHMVRARGALEVRDEALFARAFFAISRFDLNLLTTRQRCQLAALILQHSGYRVLSLSTRGNPLSGATGMIKHALSCCLQLMVETEPMDLSRLLVSLAHRTVTVARNSSYVSHSFVPVADLRADKSASIAVYLDDLDINDSASAQFDITKFKQLRISSVYRYKGLGISAALQQGRRKNDKSSDIMRFSMTPLLKSLLKYDTASAINPRLHLEAFNILLAIMGDKPITSLARPAKGTVLQNKSISLGNAVLDIIDAASNRYPIMRNELYFQLVKQLTENPRKRSWVRGWLLMTLYLHSFAPSVEALPYVRNYVEVSLKSVVNDVHTLVSRALHEQTQGGGDASPTKVPTSAASVVGSVTEEDISATKYCSKVISYCSSLLSRMEIMLHNNKAAYHDSTGSPLLYKPIVASTSANFEMENTSELAPNLSAPLIERAYEQKGLDFEIALMTGSVIKFSVPYGQCSTPFSFLQYLYDKLLPEDAYFERTHHTFQQSEDAIADVRSDRGGTNAAAQFAAAPALGSSYLSPEMKAHRVMALFRGFALYSLQESDYNDERTDIDMQRVPVQPDYSQCMDWTKDLQWDLLQLHTSEEHGTEADIASGAFKFSNTLLLRRRTSMLQEEFCDEFELFQDQVSDRDVTALQELWAKWLSSEAISLPSDHVRVDLIYAEDTRYVNSRLYPLSSDSLHYLLAMQLALCWIDGEAEDWADPDETVMQNATISVRPCYKFPPQHLIDAPLALGSPHRGLTAAEELDMYAADAAAAEKSTAAQDERSRSGDSDSDSDVDVPQRRGSTSSEDSDSSSSYVTTVASESVVEASILQPLTDPAGLTETDLELLQRLIALSGVFPEAIDLEKVIERIVQFHAVAIKAGVPLSSPKYRYLLKRAYVHYLSSASAFYGSHFAEATYVPDPNHATKKKRADALAPKKGKRKGKNARAEDEESEDGGEGDREPADVLVAVSVGALVLLDPETWDVRFSCPIWDVLDFSVIIADNGSQLLVFNINGMDLALRGDKVHEILDMLDACCREALGRGFFPYGSDETRVPPGSQHQAPPGAAAGAASLALDEDTAVYQTNSKKIFKNFLHMFPMLPRPPIPETAARAEKGFIATPKSQRDLFAKERAEEERLEHEISRAAAEAQLERNQRHIEQGRENMKMYQKANKTGEDGSDGSDAEEGTATRRQSALARKRKNNRSVFGDASSTEEIRMQLQQDRISSLACGVSRKTSTKFGDYVIPAAPTRVGGAVKLVTSNDKKRSLRRPVILESRGMEAVLERAAVRISLAAEPAAEAAPAPASPVRAGAAAKPSMTISFGSANAQASESTLLGWSNDRLQSALLEQSTNAVMQFHQRTEETQGLWHQSAELLEGNTPDAPDTEDTPPWSAPERTEVEQGQSEPDAPQLARPSKDPYLHGVSFYLRKKKRGVAPSGTESVARHAQEAEEQEGE